MEQGSEIREMVNLLHGMREDMKDFRKNVSTLGSQPNSSSNVTFKVDGSGLGFRLVVLACVAQLILTFCGMAFVIYSTLHQDSNLAAMQVKQDHQQDYLNVILQWAPELRNKINQVRNNQK